MAGEHPALDAQAALAALSDALRKRFPEAQCRYRESPDGLSWYLDVATDCADDFAVLEVVEARTVELYLAAGVQVHVFPFQRSSFVAESD